MDERVGMPVHANNKIMILCFSQGTAIRLGGINQMAMEYEAQRTEADNDSESEETEQEDEDNI